MEEEPDEAEYLPWCDKITEARKTIEALRAEINAAKEADEGDYVIVPVDVAYPSYAEDETAPEDDAVVAEETADVMEEAATAEPTAEQNA